MLVKTEIKLEIPDNFKPSFHLGSVFHGVLNENIPAEHAECLHKNNIKPISQYLTVDYSDKTLVWTVNSVQKDFSEMLCNDFIKNLPNEIKLKKSNVTLKVKSKEIISKKSYKDFTNEYYLKDNPQRRANIRFLTPATFKIGGEYTVFPDISNVYKSLYNKFNTFASEVSLDDEEVLKHLMEHSKIIGYNLKSTKFGVEGVRIASFLGEICVYIKGPEALSSIANLLFAFGEFSGIGAKTTLGMGGVKVE